MTTPRKVSALLFAAAALAGAGCKSDDAAEKDIKNATEDVDKATDEAGRELEEAGKNAEKAIPGDADDDGR